VQLVTNSLSFEGGKTSGPGVTTGFAEDGSQEVSEFGVFNFVLKNNDGWTCAVSKLIFSIENKSGSWSSDTDVLTLNNKDYLAASHIFVPNSDGSGAISTGFASNGNPVPIPAAVYLFGSGLAALGFIPRRKLKK
jgi:hypothetical protein